MKYCCLMIICCLGWMGCGGLDAREASYEGTLTQTTKTNFGMRTSSTTQVISVFIDGDDAQIGLHTRCVLGASADGETLTISKQTCKWTNDKSEETWRYEGQGVVKDDGSLSLTLSATFTRSYDDNTPDLDGFADMMFGGKAR